MKSNKDFIVKIMKISHSGSNYSHNKSNQGSTYQR